MKKPLTWPKLEFGAPVNIRVQVQNVTPDGCDCPCLPLVCGMFSNSLLFPKAENVLCHEGISVPRILKKGLCKKKGGYEQCLQTQLQQNYLVSNINRDYGQKATSEISPGISAM